MKLGGPLDYSGADPEIWVAEARRRNDTACYAPANKGFGAGEAAAFAAEAAEAGITIAECGAWSNPIDPGPAKAAGTIGHCRAQLAFAKEIGARCCVNIAGSRNPDKWDGPHPENFSRETFDLIVESVRKIIDAGLLDQTLPTPTAIFDWRRP